MSYRKGGLIKNKDGAYTIYNLFFLRNKNGLPSMSITIGSFKNNSKSPQHVSVVLSRSRKYDKKRLIYVHERITNLDTGYKYNSQKVWMFMTYDPLSKLTEHYHNLMKGDKNFQNWKWKDKIKNLLIKTNSL